ncbi:ATP-binding protein [Leptolyngbya sp. ST-U4]|uniref:ATP-binding protein n=1 Tax=Leptolyngbya sp. ST-U4 TaxID=2933912 RepID=UPI0019A75AE1|nr:PAS domain-containing protein [Cyanobacteria bacterium FACHB-502]
MQRPQPETITLNDILITEELFQRSPRLPNLQAENQAMRSLVQQMARDSESLMQILVETALELCQAGTAGISLLETTADGEETFRWNILAGTLAHYGGSTTSRNFSPCGVCLEQGTPVLFSHPERYFTYFQATNTPIVEGLVLPLIADSHIFGTIWIMSHDEQRHFDAEDVRVMTSLADFAAAALLLNQRQTQELLAKNAQLEVEVVERQRSHEALRESEKRLQVMVENLPGGAVFVVDRDLRYLLAEGEALLAAGFKPEDLVGRTIFEVMPPELIPTYEALYRKALAGEPFEHEHNAHDRTYVSHGTPLRSPNGEINAVLAASYDISERKKAEAALRESEAKYRSLFESIDEGFAVIEVLYDENGKSYNHKIIQANQAFSSHSGIEAPEGKLASELMPGVEQFWNELYARVIETNASERMEVHSEVFDRWFEVIVSPLNDGSTHCVAVAFVDNTKRKRSEAAQRKSEAKYRSLFGNINDGFCIIELLCDDGQLTNFRFLEANPAFEQQIGVTQAIGKTAHELVPNLEAEFFTNCERVLATGEPTEFENYSADLDRYYRVLAYPHGDPQNKQLALLFNDISDRKHTEVQLRRAAELDAFRVTLSDALRSLSDPAAIQGEACRLVGEQLSIDRAFYTEINETEGWALIEQDYVGDGSFSIVGVLSLSDYSWALPVYNRGEILMVSDVASSDLISESDQNAMGAIQVAAVVGIPLIKEGVLVGAFVVADSEPREWTDLDIELTWETGERIWAAIERARAEAALRESEIQRIREQVAREEERQQAETLAELDRAKTLFFSNVSHELRTPLTLILAPLQDALKHVGEWEHTDPFTHLPIHPSTLKHDLQLAHRNSLRLLKLVNTLLDFSRIEAGRMEAVYEPTDLALFTTELASVFRSAIERAGLQLIVDCPPLPQSVFVDRDMWEKIILNLLSNAFKFTFEGEITVRLYSTEGNQAILQIQDTGTGIAPEHLPHLFERFYQIRGTQARTYEGSGIGLALVHELVRLQGGTIEVSSTLGKGTCFTIALPLGTRHLPNDRLRRDGAIPFQNQDDRLQPTRTLVSTAINANAYIAAELPEEEEEQESKEAREPEDVISDAPTPRCSAPIAHVLLVDDNTDMRQYLSRILSEYVQIQAVADGASALAAAQAQVPDLILSDVMMPGLDGFQLLQALRSDPRTREVPIILLSARAGEEAIVEGLKAGADDYLIKPFSAQELISRVNAHLQMAQLRGEALQEARRIIRSRDEMISTVSHELNTPLVSILGWTRLLRNNPPNPVMLTKALDTIERNATLQAKLVQDLLDISRITAGKLSLNPQPIALESVIEAAIATVAQTAAEKGIRLTWQENRTEPVAVMGDSDRLQQVICNLLTNAIKFTLVAGSVSVELAVLDNYDSANRAYAEIRVMDTGMGIAAESLPQVFDRFHQARASDAAKGLGLGLTIACHIVELHKGTIHAESAGEGQGSTFIVRLPLLS